MSRFGTPVRRTALTVGSVSGIVLGVVLGVVLG